MTRNKGEKLAFYVRGLVKQRCISNWGKGKLVELTTLDPWKGDAKVTANSFLLWRETYWFDSYCSKAWQTLLVLSPVKWIDAQKRTVLEVTTYNVISWVMVPVICTLESTASFHFSSSTVEVTASFFHLSSKVINKAHCSLNIWFLGNKSKSNFFPEQLNSWAESIVLNKTPILQWLQL